MTAASNTFIIYQGTEKASLTDTEGTSVCRQRLVYTRICELPAVTPPLTQPTMTEDSGMVSEKVSITGLKSRCQQGLAPA